MMIDADKALDFLAKFQDKDDAITVWNLIGIFLKFIPEGERRKYSGLYCDYLESDQWKFKRRNMFDLLYHTCFVCGSESKAIHFHHCNYEELFNETDRTCVPLCEDCHKLVHEAAKFYTLEYNKFIEDGNLNHHVCNVANFMSDLFDSVKDDGAWLAVFCVDINNTQSCEKGRTFYNAIEHFLEVKYKIYD